MKLYTDHITGLPVLDVELVLEDRGYPVDVLETHIVPSSDGEKAYTVKKLQTTAVPLERADAVEDETTTWVCSCDDYRFRRAVDAADKTVGDTTPCKHITQVARAEQAEADDQQAALSGGYDE